MNRMKKFMALFLAVVLIAQTGFAASAEEDTSSVEPAAQNETLTEDAGPQEETDAADLTGQQPENSEDTTSEGTSETEQGEEESDKEDGEQPEAPADETGDNIDEVTPPADQNQGEDEQKQEQDQEQQDPTAPAEENGEDVETPVVLNELPEEEVEPLVVDDLTDGINIIRTDAEGLEFNIDEGKAIMIASPDDSEEPIVFNNCTFNLSGGTVKISGTQDGISYNNGETVTKLWIGGNVTFNNCTFKTEEGATKTTTAGYDAAIYFFSGDINLNNCTLSAEGYNGQFLGLYGKSGAVTFDHCNISTVDNTNGWSYAMYAQSVLVLKNSMMTATGMTIDSGNTNAFYSGDDRKGYDAIYLYDSTINFSENKAGGLALNNITIHVVHSNVIVNNNSGNASNSGYWSVSDGSTIQMNGNRGGHAMSCNAIQMTDSKLEVLHNGYAGVYINGDSSFIDSTVDIRCNGEKMLSYSAGDVWLNKHTLIIENCTSEAMPGAAWLGAVGRKGAVSTLSTDDVEIETVGSSKVVAYDLNTNADDNLKSNTEPVLTNANVLALDEHTLFLNPFMDTPYARGNAEVTAENNDADLFADDKIANGTYDSTYVIGKETAKIGTLTEAQLSHHKYDWENGEITEQATEDTYGVIQYACTDVCAAYMNNTTEHTNSFDCVGTYVYAPLVGLAFDANTTDTVEGMPANQTQITYGGTATAPEAVPTRESGSDQYTYVFGGWYADPECTQEFDFSTALTENWTVAYAKWTRNYAEGVDPEGYDINITKTAEQLDANDETTVQLGIGSTEERNKVAVLFVLDYSTSVNVRNAAADMLEELASKDKTDVKVGVVNYWADADEGVWTDITADTDVNSLLTATNTGGTNYHAGLLSAQKLLASDEIEGYTTYLITISDGITYLWTDEDTGATQSVWFQNIGNGPDDIQNGNSVYDMKYHGEEIPEDTFMELVTGSGDTVAKYNKTIEKAEVYADSVKPDPVEETNRYWALAEDDVMDSTLIGSEIAIYKTASVYKELADSVDYAYAFKMDENHWGSYPYGEQLMDYLASISNGGKISDTTAKSTFDTIKNQILYAIERGSVADIIGNDFDLTSVDSITLSAGGTEVPGAVDKVNANVKNFGTADENGVYPYTVEYVPGAAGEEQLIWTINVPVENANRLVLSYGLKLVNKSTTAGTYGQYDRDGSQGYEGIQTNVSAVLDYETTTGDTGSKNFPKPTVSYTVVDNPATINITKKVQNSSGAAVNVNATFYAAVFTDPQFTNRFGDVVELKLNGTSQVTVSVAVEAPADGSSRSYYVTETDKNGNVIIGGESFGYQIGIEGSMVTVSESAPAGSVTITNKQIASSGNQGGGGTGGGSSSGGNSSSSSQTVASAQTGDNTNILLPIAVIIVAAAALVVCVTVYRRKRS